MPLPEGISAQIVMCGASGVGKTSLLKQYVNSEFSKDEAPSLGIDTFEKDVGGGKIWQFIDTTEAPAYTTMCEQYHKGE